MEKLYGFRDAAETLGGISESTLREKAALRLVPHRKVFRRTMFSEQDLAQIQQVRPARSGRVGTGRRRCR